MYKINHLDREWVFQHPVSIPPDLREVIPNAELVLQTLVRRGFTNPEEILKYIDHTRFTPAPPYDLPDMEKGVQRIFQAVQRKERIGVWGDFDVDGQTSTAILISTLRELGADCVYHIPVRGPETHGIGLKALQDFLASGIQMILTCDTGVSAYEGIDYAQSRGIDVVVTDHHLLPETLPSAYALINPRRLPPTHPLSTLPGAGTACKFAEALLSHSGKQRVASELHDLAALGIIADLADLYGDARYLVQSGIDQLRGTPRPALAALLEAAEVDPQNLSEEQISFIIAPRLNAVGRLSDANPMVEFLLSSDPGEIAMRVNQIEGLNGKRKILSDQIANGAQSMLEQDRTRLDHAVLVLHHPEWPAGVVGIVASRLVEIYHRPVILLSGQPDAPLRGSARSVEGVDITAALRMNEHLLLGYGGHPMAAVLSLNAESLPALIRGLDTIVSKELAARGGIAGLTIDHAIQPSEFTLDLARSLDLLAPYGPGNPSLVFCGMGMQLVNSRSVGKLNEHVLVDVEDALGNQNRFIWWNGSGLSLPDGKFDLAYTARASNYRGEDQVSLEWIDYRQTNAQIDLLVQDLKPQWLNIDLRHSPIQLAQVKLMADHPHTLVWAEGSAPLDINYVDRRKLRPCRDLVIWSVPPNMEFIASILQTVAPERIHWCLVSPPEHQASHFLTRLITKVKTFLNAGVSEIDLSELASSVSAAESTIEIALDWLAARGDITIINQQPGKVTLALGGSENLVEQKRLEAALRNVFNELSAFSRYLRQVDLDQLTENLR